MSEGTPRSESSDSGTWPLTQEEQDLLAQYLDELSPENEAWLNDLMKTDPEAYGRAMEDLAKQVEAGGGEPNAN